MYLKMNVFPGYPAGFYMAMLPVINRGEVNIKLNTIDCIDTSEKNFFINGAVFSV